MDLSVTYDGRSDSNTAKDWLIILKAMIAIHNIDNHAAIGIAYQMLTKTVALWLARIAEPMTTVTEL